jgi:hypothetical protein
LPRCSLGQQIRPVVLLGVTRRYNLRTRYRSCVFSGWRASGVYASEGHHDARLDYRGPGRRSQSRDEVDDPPSRAPPARTSLWQTGWRYQYWRCLEQTTHHGVTSCCLKRENPLSVPWPSADTDFRMACVVFGNGPNAVGDRHRLGMANALRKPTQQELIAFFEEFSQLTKDALSLIHFFHLPHSSIRIKIEGWRRGREALSQFGVRTGGRASPNRLSVS